MRLPPSFILPGVCEITLEQRPRGRYAVTVWEIGPDNKRGKPIGTHSVDDYSRVLVDPTILPQILKLRK